MIMSLSKVNSLYGGHAMVWRGVGPSNLYKLMARMSSSECLDNIYCGSQSQIREGCTGGLLAWSLIIPQINWITNCLDGIIYLLLTPFRWIPGWVMMTWWQWCITASCIPSPGQSRQMRCRWDLFLIAASCNYKVITCHYSKSYYHY